MEQGIQEFTGEEEFYADDERRRRSVEIDYGAEWKDENQDGPWRVSYIQDTGEIYALKISGGVKGPLLLLGQIGPRNHREADRLLEGWENRNLREADLAWIRERTASCR